MSEDLTKKLPKKDSEKLDLIITAVQALTSKTTSLEGTVALMQLRLDAIDSRVEALDKKVEERLYDTRPIWEQVVANVEQLQLAQQRFEERQQRFEERQQRFEERQQRFEESQQRLEQGQQRLEQEFGEMKLSVTSLQEGQHRIQERLKDNGSREIKTFLRDILRRMSIFNDTLLGIQADYRDIYDRVRHLELRNTEV